MKVYAHDNNGVVHNFQKEPLNDSGLWGFLKSNKDLTPAEYWQELERQTGCKKPTYVQE